MIPWREAWHEALYGAAGFYRSTEGPAGHFATSAHPPLGPVFAEAVLRYAARLGLTRIVDVGCGRGELLLALRTLDDSVELTGVDVVERPAALPDSIDWIRSPGGADLPADLSGLTGTLALANEWLDVVPCTVAQVDEEHLLRTVLVDPLSGVESLGTPLVGDELAWADRWWPRREVGDRVEIGLDRDRAFADLVDRVSTGTVIAVDYGHLMDDRPSGGTLTAYRAGLPTAPIADGSCDLTVHVAMDSLPGAIVVDQRTAIRDSGIASEHPPMELAHTDPAAYVEGLSRMGVVAQLTDPRGLGGFLWAIRHVPGGGPPDAAG